MSNLSIEQTAVRNLRHLAKMAAEGDHRTVVGSAAAADPAAMEMTQALSKVIGDYVLSGRVGATAAIVMLAVNLGFFIGDTVNPSLPVAGLGTEASIDLACNLVRGVAEDAFTENKKEYLNG